MTPEQKMQAATERKDDAQNPSDNGATLNAPVSPTTLAPTPQLAGQVAHPATPMHNQTIAANVQPIVQPVVQAFELENFDSDDKLSGKGSEGGSPIDKGKSSQGDGDKESEEEEEDNYMEMYVQDQFKEKLEPINERIDDVKKDIEGFEDKIREQLAVFQKYDLHYTMILKAMLSRMGINISNLDGHKVLREFQRLKAKEELSFQKMKKKEYPDDLEYLAKMPVTTKATISPTTNYVIALTKAQSAAITANKASLDLKEGMNKLSVKKGLSTDNHNLLLAQKLLHKGVPNSEDG